MDYLDKTPSPPHCVAVAVITDPCTFACPIPNLRGDDVIRTNLPPSAES